MKLLLCHNFYRNPGGEDHGYRDECWLLEKYGHEVIRYECHNQAIDDFGQLQLASSTIWSDESDQEISERIEIHRVDVAHFRNTFPLISPSGYYAARRAGAPAEQTRHRFRTMIEAFAAGTPVVASNIGSMKELVTDCMTGLHFRVSDPAHLATEVLKFNENDAFFCAASIASRVEYEQKYTAEKNYELLIDIYRKAVGHPSEQEVSRG